MLRPLLLAWALCIAAPASAQDVLPVPALATRVVDQTGTLKPEQRAAIEAKLAAFEAQSGPQIVVLLVPTTAPEDIAAYAQRVAEAWKIGRRDVGDGVLLVVSKGDRKVRIEVAKALEGAIPDLAARQIIDTAVRPAFRADDYAGGLNAAVDKLVQRIQGEGLPLPSYATTGAAGMDVVAAEDFDLAPGQRHAVATGFRVAIPEGYEIQVRPRSGLAFKHGISVPNTPGTIDSDYRGELKILLINHGPDSFAIRRGDRIAQLVPAAVTFASFDEVAELDDTNRGAGGFGSTGQ